MSSSKPAVACQCDAPAPHCKHCGLPIEVPKESNDSEREMVTTEEEAIIANNQKLQTLVNNGLSNIMNMPDAISRGCNRVATIFQGYFGDGLKEELAQLETNEDKIHLICTKIILEDVEPLIQLLKIISLQSGPDACLDECLESLELHQASVPQPLSVSTECSSPIPPEFNAIKKFHRLIGFKDSTDLNGILTTRLRPTDLPTDASRRRPLHAVTPFYAGDVSPLASPGELPDAEWN